MPDYIDIHTHLNFAAFDDDRESVIRRTLGSKVWAINVGTQYNTSKSAVEIAHAYEGMFAAIGLHPIHTSKSFHDSDELGEGGMEFTSRGEFFDSGLYSELAMDNKVLAIGECGLDYFRLEEETKKKQQDGFLQQIQLANLVRKPLMLHIRNAYADAFDILKANARVPMHLHFFAGSIDEARLFLDIGCTFSFTGVITFARNYDELIKFLPIDRIMAETDAPYVAPEPHRGKRNEPRFVAYTVEKLSFIKGLSGETVRKQMLLNASRVFSIKLPGKVEV